MGPKSKKHKFRTFSDNNVQEIEEKLKETELNNAKTKRSQKTQGNHSAQNILHPTKKGCNNTFKKNSYQEQSYRQISIKNIESTSNSYLGTSVNVTKGLSEAETSECVEAKTCRRVETEASGAVQTETVISEVGTSKGVYKTDKFGKSIGHIVEKSENQEKRPLTNRNPSPQSKLESGFDTRSRTIKGNPSDNRSTRRTINSDHYTSDKKSYGNKRLDHNKNWKDKTLSNSKERQSRTDHLETSDSYWNNSITENSTNENNEWNDIGTFVGHAATEEKDVFWEQNDYSTENESFRSSQKLSNKQGSGYRKSESFVGDRNEKKDYYSRRSDSNFSRPYLSEDFADPEYKEFQKEVKKSENVVFKKVKEIEGDLFDISEDYSLGHCVAADMRMGSGIAVKFKKVFGNLGKLLSQNQKPGGLAILELDTKIGKRYIYYLVTKDLSNGKPTYENFWSSLQKMRNHIKDNGIKKLAIPKIGCGLDRLEWGIVKHMIAFLFKNIDVEIVVCNFQQIEDSPSQRDNTCKVVFDENPVVKIDKGTIIIYFTTEKGEIEEDVVELSKKFNFMDQFKRTDKILGNAIRFEEKSRNYILYGCIVRKTSRSNFDFDSFAKCLLQIKKNNKKDQFYYVAYQSITDRSDFFINDKIITLLRNLLRNVEIYVCKSHKTENSNLEE